MATDFIDRLRSATFPTARRGGYDPDAVDGYLRQLADWLETGGDDQTRTALVQREMERVGERTGTILSAAQESADRITSDARAEAGKLRADAEAEAAETRSAADAYATETRNTADEHVRISAEAATREASDLKVKAEAESQEKIGAADSHLQRANEEAAARTAGVEEEIADLLSVRNAVLAKLEELANGIRGVIEGPGSAEVELPERVEALVTGPASEDLFDQETRVQAVVTAAPEAPASDPAEEEPAETELIATDPEATEPFEMDPDGDEPDAEEEGSDPDPDTDEQDRVEARERELERRRRPQRSTDPTTEDSNLTDLL